MSDKVDVRRNEILKLLERDRVISVNQLAGHLQVSIETIRKDLAALVARDLVVRVHGGAGLSHPIPRIFDTMTHHNADKKHNVASIAVELIKPGTSIMLEDGSTSYALAQVLCNDKPDLLSTLTVITNSFPICALFKAGAACERLFFLGGLCDSGRQATLGHFASQQLAAFHAQQLFIAPAGISPSLNVVAWASSDAAFQIEALKCADEKILMTDSSKFLSSAWLNVAPLESFDHIVTDMELSDPMMQQLLRKKLPVYLPEKQSK